MNDKSNLKSQEKALKLNLEDFLILSNGTDKEGDPLSAGSIHIWKQSEGQNEAIRNYELPGAIYEILIRDRFLQVNMDFQQKSRHGLALAKIAMKKYDKLTNTQEDFEGAVYSFSMILFPLEVYGRLSLVMINPVLWVGGENPDDKSVQRLSLLFEKENCQFVTNESIDVSNVRAGIEREMKQQYEQEQELAWRQQEQQKEVHVEAERAAANAMILDLTGLERTNDHVTQQQDSLSRLRFSENDNTVEPESEREDVYEE